MKERIYKLDFIKTKHFYSAKDTVKRMKNDRKKTFAKDILDKEINQNIQKNQKTNNSIRKQARP